jgi:translation elongation factor EF-4
MSEDRSRDIKNKINEKEWNHKMEEEMDLTRKRIIFIDVSFIQIGYKNYNAAAIVYGVK